MELYHLSQDENTGYDTYSDCVVCAENELEAKKIHPGFSYDPVNFENWWEENSNYLFNDWATSLDRVQVRHIGTAAKEIEKGCIFRNYRY